MKTRIIKIIPALFVMLFLVATLGCRVRVEASTSASVKTQRAHPVVQAEPQPAPTSPSPVVATTPPSPPPAPPQPPFQPSVGTGVTVVQNPCPNTPEQLNGIDDDCDGMVDEDWVKSGPLQITLWWNAGPDLDLEVIDPTGKAINVKNRQSPSGGMMDKDSRSACKGGETIENIFWSANPPKGTYTINVNYYSSCGQKANPPDVEANVGISYNGQFVGPFKKVLKSKEEAEIVKFALE